MAMKSTRSAIPLEVELSCAYGLVLYGDGKVVVLWVRGIGGRRGVDCEFCQRTGAALLWPRKK
jgi:hypothetical protein